MLLRSRCIQLYLNMSLHVSRSAISEHGKLTLVSKAGAIYIYSTVFAGMGCSFSTKI